MTLPGSSKSTHTSIGSCKSAHADIARWFQASVARRLTGAPWAYFPFKLNHSIHVQGAPCLFSFFLPASHLRKTMRVALGMKMIVSSHTCAGPIKTFKWIFQDSSFHHFCVAATCTVRASKRVGSHAAGLLHPPQLAAAVAAAAAAWLAVLPVSAHHSSPPVLHTVHLAIQAHQSKPHNKQPARAPHHSSLPVLHVMNLVKHHPGHLPAYGVGGGG